MLFAHGGGSSRRSPRNQYVAKSLQAKGFATLLMDLLTENEAWLDERTAQLRFDIELLAWRLVGAVDWLGRERNTEHLPIGLFGASTGAAAALVAAARRPTTIVAVVSRGGRPDLAGVALPFVAAPRLLIVGSLDREVMLLNREAMGQMHGEVALELVPGATHLFEEQGKLEEVAKLAKGWFVQWLHAPAANSPAGAK